ncbi:MAG: DoxX family protein [Acidobacteriota bacterium]
MNTSLIRLSRALVALIFVIGGLGKIAAFSATKDFIASVGFPLPALFLAGAIAFEVFGGIALLVGYKVRWAAGALIIFLIPATIIFHAMNLTDAAQGQQQMIEVLKNLAIIGALVKFLADESIAPRLAAPAER